MTEEQKLTQTMNPALPPASQPYAPGAGNIKLLEEQGVRYLHFGTPWVQGAMRIDDPYVLEIEYVQQMMMWMLFADKPEHIVQLGLGAGSLTKFCWRQFPQSRITAVELDPAVIETCRHHFDLPADDQRLTVLQMDAMDFVLDPARHGTVDILQVDLYDALAVGPVLGSPEFYQACADCLAPEGMLTINLFCDYPEHLDHLDAIAEVFHAAAHLPEVHDGNIVAIAFKNAPSIDFSELHWRAHRIGKKYGLKAESWVDGLEAWMAGIDS
ncbi:fused MFS/spermidine synthase [Allopusillimonas ginsengisoli]|uniref:fused MFS/spermidine synthase n=1 Tax=Allopusillimonas ginsengisoli TaxID=453575 RepID=UPI0010C1675D|nr:methyltransferase domain-containing protein [Allopusillimonas ginsengisoli]